MTNLTEKKTAESTTQQVPFFEYFLIFIFIMYAGQSNGAVFPISFAHNPIGAIIPLVLCGILVLRTGIIFNKKFFVLLFGVFIYFVAISIKYREIHPFFLVYYFSYFFIVYVLVTALGLKIFTIFEKLNFYLAVVSLFFMVVQVLLRGDTLFSLFSKLPHMETWSRVTGEGANIFIYSVQPVMSSILYNFAIPRNCGYAWEPGAFAVYLCLAIFINLFFIEPDKQSRNRLWILILTLLTTQSTTGYLIFIVIMASYLLRKKLNVIILVLPVTVVVLIYVSSLPFMSKKVINLIDDTKRIDQLVEDYYGSETPASPQRFTSLLIAWIDFKDNPVLGIGVQGDEGWTFKLGSNISVISGIGNLMAQFGLVGLIFFITLLLKSSIFFSRYFKFNSIFLLFYIIVFISISYSILFIPAIMCFWMFHFFAPESMKALARKQSGSIAPATVENPVPVNQQS
jgi:hypothetical protein